MKNRFKILFISILATLSLQAQDIPEPMSPPRLVNDFAQIFKPQQEQNLETILRNYHDSTSTQIYVVTVSTLDGYDASSYASQLGEKWGVGQKGKDNGIVLLIKPRIEHERGQVYIASGYGVEHILTDGRIGRIIDYAMMPYLQTGDYYSASMVAVNEINLLLSGEFDPMTEEEPLSTGAIIVIVLLTILVPVLLALYLQKYGPKGDGNDDANYGGGRNSGGGTTYNPRRGGFGGFGGSGGGSFGGGGGGRFGGGGAGRGF